MSLICLKLSVKGFPRKENRKLTSFQNKFSNHASRELTLLQLTLINQWLQIPVKQEKKRRRQLYSGEIAKKRICSQCCYTAVHLWLKLKEKQNKTIKPPPDIWGVVTFEGKKVEKLHNLSYKQIGQQAINKL